MIIKNVHIEKFRGLKNVDFNLGEKITTIVGHNGTMKTTILGILSQTFTISSDDNPMKGEQTIDGYNFHSQFGEKFKLSDKDIPGDHLWRLQLYPNIYKNDSFEVKSISRGNGSIRFWSTEGKGVNTGYPQVPAYYISLKRVTPIGEEKKINQVDTLTEDENKFLKSEYKKVFSYYNNDELSVDTLSSTNKKTASIHNSKYDSLAISAGQDALGKLLIAVLSFKRLKDKFPKEYKGGLLLIDEIESTFHPLAQKQLIGRIYKYARDYRIQFIFTTHSPSVIKSAFFDKHNNKDSQLVYLKKVGDRVMGINNPNIDSVIAELSGEVLQNEKKTIKKVTVFTEDDVARQVIQQWLKAYKKNINFNTCSIGAEEYVELLRVKLEPITESIVILDGDKNCGKITNKLTRNKISNVIFLPSQFCPEKMFYSFLLKLPDNHEFWDLELGKFDKHKCFQGYNTLLDDNADTEQYKKWFADRKKNFGRAGEKLYNIWAIMCPDEYNSFVEQFKEKYNKIAIRIGADIID